MEPADPQASRAVLIGTAEYAHLPGIPAVRNNLAKLREILTDPRLWGLPDAHCRTLLDASANAVAKAVRVAATEVGEGGLLLVYFAGHGLINPSDRHLVLGLPGTEVGWPAEEGLPYARIREGVMASPAAARLVILDCCYAARAEDAGGLMAAEGSEAQAIADLALVDRTCLLVAASRNGPAHAPVGAEHTAFTGEILRILAEGVRNGPAALTVGLVWEHTLRALRAKNVETPEIRAGNGGEKIVLVRNAARRRPELTGAVLAAAPDVGDGDLQRAVILVMRHDPAQGAIGIRLNRRSGRTPAVPEAWQELLADPKVVFDGGPMSNGTSDGYIAAVLLRPDEDEPLRFQPVRERIGVVPLTSDPEDLRARASRARLFSGYLGWGPGELEQDLDGGVLRVVDRPLWLLTSHPDSMWAQAWA